MKIAIIGAGNVGGLAGLRIVQEGLGSVVLCDPLGGLARGKALDTLDAQALVGVDYRVAGTDDISQIKDSDIVVVTAGLPRKPGMTREDLLKKNADIVGSVGRDIKKYAARSRVIVVTNPLDLMTLHMLKITGFSPEHVMGMGVSLDAGRFAHLISEELHVPVSQIVPQVIGSHGEGMLPLTRLTTVKGVSLDEILDETKRAVLVQRTIDRGKEIVTLFGSGSAYVAPSAAIAELVRALAKDERRTLGVAAYISGQYGIDGICIGVPCVIGANGIEKIVELDLDPHEQELLVAAAARIREQAGSIAM